MQSATRLDNKQVKYLSVCAATYEVHDLTQRIIADNLDTVSVVTDFSVFLCL